MLPHLRYNSNLCFKSFSNHWFYEGVQVIKCYESATCILINLYHLLSRTHIWVTNSDCSQMRRWFHARYTYTTSCQKLKCFRNRWQKLCNFFMNLPLYVNLICFVLPYFYFVCIIFCFLSFDWVLSELISQPMFTKSYNVTVTLKQWSCTGLSILQKALGNFSSFLRVEVWRLCANIWGKLCLPFLCLWGV